MEQEQEVDLIQYLPGFLQEIREFRELSKAENPEFKRLYEDIDALLNNGFIHTADLQGVKRWEKLLRITAPTSSMEGRKAALLGKWNRTIPYTMVRLYEYLDALTARKNYHISFPEEYRMELVAEDLSWDTLRTMRELIGAMLPANMLFVMTDRVVCVASVPWDLQAKMRMTGAFYPRDNIPPFYLDGTAGLDGEYYLDGFLSGESLDFYPVALQIRVNADWQTRFVGTVQMRPWVQLDVQNDMIFRLWGAMLTGGTVAGEMRLLFDTCPKTALNTEILVRARAIQLMEVKNFLCVQGAAVMKTIASGGLHLAGEIQAKNTFDGKITARTEIIQTLTSRGSLTIAGEIYAKKNLASRLYFAGGIGAEAKISGEITAKAQAVQNMGEDTSFSIQGTASAEGSVCTKELQISGDVGEVGRTVSVTGGLRIEKNWGTLDGSELLDGSRILDAEVYTEEI